MKNEEFLRLCKAKVAEYTNSHMDKTDGKQITVSLFIRLHSLPPNAQWYSARMEANSIEIPVFPFN